MAYIYGAPSEARVGRSVALNREDRIKLAIELLRQALADEAGYVGVEPGVYGDDS